MATLGRRSRFNKHFWRALIYSFQFYCHIYILISVCFHFKLYFTHIYIYISLCFHFKLYFTLLFTSRKLSDFHLQFVLSINHKFVATFLILAWWVFIHTYVMIGHFTHNVIIGWLIFFIWIK